MIGDSVLLRGLTVGLALSAAAWAQSGTSDADAARVISPTRGFQPSHSYALSDIESIDQATAALSFHIPLAQLPPGPAGFTAGVALSYSSKYWEVEPNVGAVTAYELKPATAGGWRLAMAPQLERELLNNRDLNDPCGPSGVNDLFQLRLNEPDGSRHTLMLSSPAVTMSTLCEPGSYTMSLTNPGSGAAETWYTTDGSYLRLVIDPATPTYSPNSWPDNASWTLYRSDGTSVRQQDASITYLRDRNGNSIKVERSTIDGHLIQTMTDAAGRSITVDNDTVANTETVTQVSWNEESQPPAPSTLTWVITYTSLGVTNGYQCVPPPQSFTCHISSALPVVSSIQLPNGLSYSFTYSGTRYGVLTGMTMPTGASVAYTYLLDTGGTHCGFACYFDVLGNPLASKTVTHDGATESWTYNYSTGSTGAILGGSVTAPDGGVTGYEFVPVEYQFAAYPDGGAITQITDPDGSIVQREWAQNRPHEIPINLLSANRWVQRELTSTANGSGTTPVATSIRVFTSDKNGNTTSHEERGWTAYDSTPPPSSNAPLLRKTITKYVNGAGDSTSTDADSNAYSNTAVGTKPLNLPQSVETQASGVVVARSTFNYQETSPARMVGNLVDEAHWDSTQAPTIASDANLTPASAPNSNAIGMHRTYTANGNLAAATDARGKTVTYSYGAVTGCPSGRPGDLYRTGMAVGGSGSVAQNWTFDYNCYTGQLKGVLGPNASSSTIVHDVYGRPRTVTEGSIRKTVHAYDDNARTIETWNDVTTFGDQANHSRFDYDQLGRLKQTRQDEGATTIVTDTRHVLSAGHDEAFVSNRYTTSPADDSPRGWTVARRDTTGRVCRTESFSGSGDPAVEANCAPSSGTIGSTSATYSVSASWTSETVSDANGVTRAMYHDALGRLTAVVEDPAGAKYTTYYTYDALDNLTDVRQAGTCSATDPVATPCSGGLSRHFDYSSLKRLTHAQNPEAGDIYYDYDYNGNLTRLRHGSLTACIGAYNANGTCGTDGYDDLNRPLKRDYSDGTPAVTYQYDSATTAQQPQTCQGTNSVTNATWDTSGAVGLLSSVSNSVSATYYFYNRLGQTQCSRQKVGSAGYDFAYTTTPQGEWRSVVYPSGRTVATQFNGRGLPMSVGNYATSVTYWPHGAVRQLTLGNQVVETTSYSNRLQADSIQAVKGANELWKLQNFYCGMEGASCGSNNGNVVSQKLTVNGGALVLATQYAYDTVNRLTSAAEHSGSLSGQTGWTQNYGYVDGGGSNGQYGNLRVTGDTVTPSSMTCGTYDALTNRCADVGYGYTDGRGNTTSYPGNRTAAFDGENRQRTLTDGATWQYGYDGEGRRVTKTGGGSSVTYVYDARGELASEYDGTVDTSGCAPCYMTVDHLGSTRMVTNESGGVWRRYDYLPFGYEIGSGWSGRSGVAEYQSQPDGTEQKFTGKERDAESGLDYFGARYFSAAQGRWTSPDLSNLGVDFWLPQTWNRYNYAVNNPLNIADRNGLWPFWIHEQIIDEAFPRMSRKDLDLVKTASWVMDYAPGQQSPSEAAKHGMSNGGGMEWWGGGNDAHDRIEADKFIDEQVKAAQEAQANWIAQGHAGIAPAALTAFGNALHTVTDRTSPPHEGEKPWADKPWWHYKTIGHVLGELVITDAQNRAANAAAQALFQRTFGDPFRWMLLKAPCATTSATDSFGNSTGSSGCQ